jgi:hypothetical protein
MEHHDTPGALRPSSNQAARPAAAARVWRLPALWRLHIGPLALLLGLLTALLAAWLLARPWSASIDVGSLYDSPYLRDFHAAEYDSAQGVGFRWSQPDAALVLPGAGRVAPLTLDVHGDYAGQPLRLATGSSATTIELGAGWQRLALLPRPDPLSGDIRLNLAASAPTTEADPRERGVALRSISIEGRGGAPPWGQAALLGLSVLLATLLGAWALRRAWAGALVGAALAGLLLAVLAYEGGAARLWLTSYSGRLLLALLLGALVALGIERALGWLAAQGLPAGGPLLRRALAGAALLAFLLRFGAMAYPLNHNSDLPFILGRTWLVREGQLLTLFLPNPSLTPVQWGEGFTIPRSPFYYILTVPVTFLPGRYGDELGMMAFSSAIDAAAVVLLALLARYAGASGRGATMAALLAATLPLGLMFIVSWGTFPTLLGQCLSLLALVLWLHLRPRLHERRAWLLLAGSLTLAFIAYPTALLFLGTAGVLLVALLALRRDAATLPTLTAGAAAVVVVFLLYYGWHIPSMVGETLPTLLGGAASSDADGITLQRTLDALWLQLADKYGALVLLLAAGGALLLACGRLGEQARAARLVVLAWGLAYVPLALADEYIVTFILKHILHLLPLLALLGGLLLGRLAQQRAGLLLAGALLALVCWQGVLLELDLIVNAFAQLK